MKKQGVLFIILVISVILVWVGLPMLGRINPFILSKTEVKTLEKKAEKGDAEACKKLSLHYSYIDDQAKSLYWLRKGEALGDGEASFDLYQHFAYEDDKEAMIHLKIAAERNHPFAQYCLAQEYCTGKHKVVEIDERRCESWYLKSANNGEKSAMVELSKLLLRMHSDEKSLKDAYKWASIALIRIQDKWPPLVKEAHETQELIIKKISASGITVTEFKQMAEQEAITEEKKIVPYVGPWEGEAVGWQKGHTTFESVIRVLSDMFDDGLEALGWRSQ